jgi:very-short-patch-repair endonuclease
MTNPRQGSLKWALDQARRDLVDLSRRNRLLHAPLGGKRPWCVAVVGHSPDELFDKLYRQENFRGYAFRARDSSDEEQAQSDALTLQSNVPQPSASLRRPRLQTRLAPDKLERRLTKIFREERTLEEEQGLSTLFLALGFLKWFDSDQAEESFAPLVLVPVTMIRVSGGDGYLLRGRDDEIVANISLREKLRTNFGIQLPDIPDDEQWKPSIYFDSVNREIIRQPRWEVDRYAAGLGFFTFSKFMMWRDLDATVWANNALLDHPLLNVLLGENADFETLPPLVPDDEPIDERIDLSKCTHVVDADSSQAIVVEEAREGRNLVVQGPPGTGKSQTITNIIASAVHKGKTVLFVAEKTAALEVVYDRLRKAGLDALCLEMHSRKAHKREVLKSLEQALRFSGASQFDANLPSKLASCRDQLNRWSNAIHKPIGQTGLSAFHVIGLQSKLRGDRVRLLDSRLDEAAGWSAAKLSATEAAVSRAAEIVPRLLVIPKDHPWCGTNIGFQSPFDLDRLIPKLNAAAEKLAELSITVNKVFAYIVENRQPCISDAFATVKAFRHVAAVPQETRSVLIDPGWVRDLAALERAIEEGERLTALVSKVGRHFRREAWKCDTARLLLTLRADGPSFLRRFSRRYRQANADLRVICRSKPPKALKYRIALLEVLQKAQESHAEFSKQASRLSAALGSVWAELRTPWTDARALAAWVRSAAAELGGARLLTLAARTRDPRVFSDFAESLETAANTARRAFDDVQKEVRADIRGMFGTSEYERVPITHLVNCVSIWIKNSSLINDWVVARDALWHLQSEGLGVIAERLFDGTIRPKEALSITELLISESLWRRATADTPEITSIDGNLRNEHVFEFRELDQQRIRAARHEVIARYLDPRPNGSKVGEMGIIKAEIEKKRRHRAIRKLVSDAGSAIQRLKPVFLMSPLSVAQFLEPGKCSFDLLVIDEASQVAPEDAFGVIARAKQMVVVGDDKQLPPTNFFKMVNAGDDDSEDDPEEPVRPDRPSDFESILTLSRSRGMSERMLAWHYRSKHPSLIALSNNECYADRLLLPPSPFIQTSEFGLSLVQTPRGYYDRGGTSRDLVQAEEVAKSVAQHIKRNPNKSLGVACLSAQQRDAVHDMIDKIGIRSEVEGFTPKGERLFVKNLEAVQGDERDVIFISVGYGVAENQSRPFLNFGPVSRDGGERRLNVLASRAREKCVVFSSITAADIPADSEVRGTRMLRALLSFAETGKLSAGTLHGDGFDSPFEESVARVIREAGFHAHSQVGVSSFRIDLGVVDPPRPGEYILGVECDGAAYHSARSARDRDRLRQEVLEGLGWRLHRIWSTDWFRNPQRESDKLLAAIKAVKDKADSRGVEVIQDDDLPEMEAHNSASEGGSATADDLDELGILSNTVEYKECVPAVPYRRDLLDLSVHEIARIALMVVEAEGPIHTEEVARRIREAFSLQKTGRRILAHVRAGLKNLSRNASVVRDGEFWSAVGRDLPAVRNRRNAPLPLRRAAIIAPAEYQLAISTIVSEAVAISRGDLVFETARLFGFDRTGSDLKEAIDQQCETLIKMGRLHLDGDVLQLSALERAWHAAVGRIVGQK